ncbi:unnamed protein product [Brachionus calyciflorus]|uniref:Uncharacterized protein n=1 Tax=Brachionus calyciflorus TaxID=104777 RepID=A0A814D653_9BILA|nr:unnamed protein product [Brachionus calyciflorus]
MIDSHLKTKKHIANSSPKESQRALDFSNGSNKETFKRDLIVGFGSANVPLHKLQNKFFKNIFDKYLKTEYNIPSVSSLRNSLPKIYEEEMFKIVNFFENSKIAIMCDETSDTLNRSVFQIIFIKLDLNVDNKPKLVDTVFLEDVNYETVSRAYTRYNIKDQFEFVASKCDKFKFALLKFENRDFTATNVYSVIFDLYFWLDGQLAIYQESENFEHYFGRKLFSDAQSKLKKYLFDGAQPATELFKNARVFDPLQVIYLSRNLDDYSFPEQIKSKLKDEWHLYLEISSEL